MRERHQISLKQALIKIRDSLVFPYVQQIILYGSCAREEEKYESDIDLLMIMKDDFFMVLESKKDDEVREAYLWLRGTISPEDYALPQVDLHASFVSRWAERKDQYAKNVRKDGILLYERKD